MIEVRALTKTYGDQRAVNGLSFTAPAGEVTRFLGPNGAGKTTTIRFLPGLAEPTSGAALIDGCASRELASRRRHVGAVLESTGFIRLAQAGTTCVSSHGRQASTPPGSTRFSSSVPRRIAAVPCLPRPSRVSPFSADGASALAAVAVSIAVYVVIRANLDDQFSMRDAGIGELKVLSGFSVPSQGNLTARSCWRSILTTMTGGICEFVTDPGHTRDRGDTQNGTDAPLPRRW